ncbi:MAG TPA: glycosyltransferase family 2 protein [Syntrophales bacterium]|nr:glycosyltransferase family 2 protein [Syntrophales bacterium]
MNDRKPGLEHISVCICTYKRPRLLERLLHKLENQQTGDRFTYSVVVVDNDVSGSAKSVVDAFSARATVPVLYDVEPERGFALVRNRAVENARNTHVAFIDDDEYPNPEWLFCLFRAMNACNADGVLGPVIPEYQIEPPEWLIKGRLCERETFETGTVLEDHAQARTGNVLLNRTLFVENPNPFDPRFGKLGGEDGDFFKRMMSNGKRFVWCNEAPVWEWVPLSRIRRIYFLKRALMRGYLESKGMHFASYSILKSSIAVILYTAALPFFSLMGQHVLMVYLIKDCDHIGKILGTCGITLFRERSF